MHVCNVMLGDCMWHEPCEEGTRASADLERGGIGGAGKMQNTEMQMEKRLEEGRLTRRGRGQFRGTMETEETAR